MPTGYTPTAVNRLSSLVIPVDGDTLNAASVNTTALKYLGDTAAYTEGRLAPAIVQGTALAQKIPGVSSSAIYKQILPIPYHTAGTSSWSFNYDDGALTAKLQTTTFSAPDVIFPLTFDMTSFGTIESVIVHVQGASGHVGLPGDMPSAGLFVAGVGGSSGLLIASATDTSASVPSYESDHYISITGFTYSISTPKLWIRVTPEAGSGALAGFTIYDIIVGVVSP